MSTRKSTRSAKSAQGSAQGNARKRGGDAHKRGSSKRGNVARRSERAHSQRTGASGTKGRARNAPVDARIMRRPRSSDEAMVLEARPLEKTHGEATSGSTTSVWLSTIYQPLLQPLQADISVDVCVIGGGIAGLTTAYLLSKAGRKVVLIEDGKIGSGETGRTTAHLSNEMDDRYTVIERLHGTEGARIAAESHSAAIDEIERIVRHEGIECDFTRLDGYLFAPPGSPPEILEQELAACRRAGLRDVHMTERAPIYGFDTGPALQFPNQGQFHPLKYIASLAAAFLRSGGSIYNDTHATEVNDSDEENPCTVRTSAGHTIAADDVVVATNSPISSWVRIHLKQAPYRTYVIGCRVQRGNVPLALYWDTADPYHYVRLHQASQVGDEDILIVGGEDHKTGQKDDTQERYARLEQWTRERFPIKGVEFRWSGQVMEPADAMAFIGRNPGSRHIYIITGDSGQGMTHGTIGGMLVRDLILGRENDWAKLYDPLRITLRSAKDLAAENLNVASQYVKDWIGPGEAEDQGRVPRGSGMVLREGAHKVACYRDADGTLYKMSATCTHLGCIVHWNSGEHSWDCPCHGSRYDPHGKVINGPAITGLEPLNSEARRMREEHGFAAAERGATALDTGSARASAASAKRQK